MTLEVSQSFEIRSMLSIKSSSSFRDCQVKSHRRGEDYCTEENHSTYRIYRSFLIFTTFHLRTIESLIKQWVFCNFTKRNHNRKLHDMNAPFFSTNFPLVNCGCAISHGLEVSTVFCKGTKGVLVDNFVIIREFKSKCH